MKAIGTKIILELEKEKEQTKAGLYLPENSQKGYKVGKVVEVGPGDKDTQMQVNVGDIVYVKNTAGVQVNVDEVDYLVVSQVDVLLVV